MPLTEQRKKELFEVLDRTSLRPKMPRRRNILRNTRIF